jgi:hypothetical protein
MPPDHKFRPPRIRCREIGEADLDAVVDLLAKSPFGRPRDFWREALQRLGAHPNPPGYAKYGYLLEVNGIAAGVLLVIAAALGSGRDAPVRCNFSSWYVWPAFRPYASLLVSVALRHKEAIYTDLSPLDHTRDLIAAQGFQRYCEGRFAAFPLARFGPPYGAHVLAAEPGLAPGPDLSAAEIAVLLDHAAYGYVSLLVHWRGQRFPFVFEPGGPFRFLRSAYLLYARSIAEFVRFARPLALYLMRRGFFVVSLDANGRVPGLLGFYRVVTPKYFKGRAPPELGDLAYSERAVLGLRFPARVAAEGPEIGQLSSDAEAIAVRSAHAFPPASTRR